jgi:hypothetical protein
MAEITKNREYTLIIKQIPLSTDIKKASSACTHPLPSSNNVYVLHKTIGGFFVFFRNT